jgi:hypothetical protein
MSIRLGDPSGCILFNTSIAIRLTGQHPVHQACVVRVQAKRTVTDNLSY